MGKKNLIVVGTGLIIIIIALGLAFQNAAAAKNAKSQLDLVNGSIQQKDQKIASLTKELKEKTDELTALKAELDTAKKALEEAKTKMDNVAQAAETTVKEASTAAAAVTEQAQTVQ